ncbi:MAG TPA: hypothetical protein PLD20_31300, partial [Blastocatellia bacterium]|nr:hypothetical protein [Blastocatellia bacterium]
MKKRLLAKKIILQVLFAVLTLAATSAIKIRNSKAAFVPTITVQNTQAGTTPDVLGYNLGHFMVGSNVADWWRYSGVKAVRVFVSPSGIEPTDDIAGTGDGVSSSSTFFARRAALRANAANAGQALDNNFINWPVFYDTYANWVADGSNRFILDPTFTALRAQGIEILANITASPSRFPLASDTDWANMWELWQHYYAEAFYLSSTYDVRRYGMFNEPNNWSPAITADDWHRRLRVCSDAIQAAIADANTRYSKSLVPQIFAPNTANGSTKYLEWGQPAVTNRHLQLDGTTNTNWLNLHIYNYQKYSQYTNDTGTSSGYIEDIDQLYADTAADMPGETVFPMALTEFNVRTGANYDTTTATQDSPSDYSAFGANVVALTEHLAKQLYLFKFAQTERTGGTYPVAKNGTHYVENATTGVNNYGGATKVAEVWRLFNKAAKGARPRYALTHTLGSDVWPIATFDATANMWYVFVSNKNTGSVTVDLDISALGVPNGNQAVIEEVSANYSGGVSATPTVSGGQLNGYSLPAQSVCLISIPAAAQSVSTVNATEDAQLGDGTSKTTTGGAVTSMQVRADGTANGRRVTLIKIPTSGLVPADLQRVLLSLTAGTISSAATIQSHVYALNDDSWTEGGATWAGLSAALKQNVGSGNVIANNIVANQGTTMQMLGQLVVTSSTNSEKLIDVTEYVRAQTDGFASFAIVQEHRWDVAVPALTTGDTQSDGIKIASRETATPPR